MTSKVIILSSKRNSSAKVSSFILSFFLLAEIALAKELRVVYFSSDPPSIVPYRAFDPDSYAVINYIFDKLIGFDYEGNPIPWIATSWKNVDPTTWEFKIRKGVKFHNGDELTSEDVCFTIKLHLDPNTKSPTQGILSSIKDCTPVDPYHLKIITHFPDGMLIWRLHMFSDVLPANYIRKVGLDKFAEKPIGTGPFMFESWERGIKIVLTKNPNYWQSGWPKYDKFIFAMVPEKNWSLALRKGEVDVVFNLAGEDANRLGRLPEIKIHKKLVHIGYQVVIKNVGPLGDPEVRKALNYAVNKQELIRVQDAGFGEVIPSLGKKGELGSAAGELTPYPYDPSKAKEILSKKGITKEKPLVINALVSDVAEKLARAIRANLLEAGVDLKLKVVPRSEWANLIPIAKMTKGKPDWAGEMAISMVDNPIKNAAFHYFIFLHSKGPFSLLNDPEYDEKLFWALTVVEDKEHERRLKEVDRMIYDRAYMIFTYQKILTLGARKNISIKGIVINGHMDNVLWNTEIL